MDITTTSLTGATTQTRGYNGDNQLVDITSTRPDNSTETHHLIWTHIPGIPQVLAHTVDGQTNNYLYGNTREAVNRPDGTTDLFAYDHLGSTVTTIPTADLAIDTGYTNYGAPTTGIDPTKIGFGYRGELHTGPTIHLRNRDYQPQHGIFTTTDPLPAVTGTPVAANPYHYTNNNPLNLTDPLGLRPSDGGFWDFLPDCITGPGCESLVSQWTGGEVCSRMYGATDVRCDSTALNRNMGYVATGFGTVSLGCSVGVVMPCSASTYAFELLSSESARYANCDRPLAVDHEQCSRAERSLAIGIIGVPVPGPFVINDFAAYLFGLQAAYGSDAAYKTSDCHPISFGPFLGSYPGPNECGQ